MKHTIFSLSLSILLITSTQAQLVDTRLSPYSRLYSLGLGDVNFTDGFWAERFKIYSQTTVPELLKTYMDKDVSHSFENFRIAAGLAEGKHSGPVFHDGDMYKTLESAASMYAISKDKNLDKLMDEIISVIVTAQRPDGYIHTPVLIQEKAKHDNENEISERLNFESYNLGHLMTAACVHFRATGKKSLLEVAVKASDFLCRYYQNTTPAQARNAICPSHYMGLIEMYRTTQDAKYLTLAEKLINIRGLMENGTDDNQDRVPFREQTKAMGHAVRANYLYAGVADLFAETGDSSLLRPLNLIWENMTQTKMYVTGACGALYDGVSPDGVSYQPLEIQKTHQAYGRDFQLPNKTAHNETCANIGNLLWNWRMFLLTGEVKYFDIVELTLYNSILSGISLDGHDFCYTNPLAVAADFPYKLRWSGGRLPYIALSNCCPPNTTRTLAEVQNYAYSLSENSLWVNIYGSNTLKTKTKDGKEIEIKQTSNYPWDGICSFEIEKMPKSEYSLRLRIPTWSSNVKILVNNLPFTEEIIAGNYLEIKNKWKKGDKITLEIPLTATLLESNPLVEETRNQVVVKRGPIVYCLESADVVNQSIFGITLPADIQLVPVATTINNSQIVCLEGRAKASAENSWNNLLYRQLTPADKSVSFRLIPYFAWGNRSANEMTVWMNLSR
ncbi:MAG: glycoside hydrolase family 127 protein [Paludibacter sp.]|jgi:DUF1680 family protein|nr:glycoside hydrolase family 127 protein [Paludibacter sp.]